MTGVSTASDLSRCGSRLLHATGFAVLLAIAWLIAAPAYGQSQSQSQSQSQVPDAMAVRDAVEDELTSDPQVPENAIVIESKNDIVTLTGVVTNLLTKERAARIAQTVKGVRSVVNEIEVNPLGDPTADQITQSAELDV